MHWRCTNPAHGGAEVPRLEVGVAAGDGKRAVSEEVAHGHQVGAGGDQPACVRVPEIMKAPLGVPELRPCGLEVAGDPAGAAWNRQALQGRADRGVHRHQAGAARLAGGDVDAACSDVIGLQAENLADAQTCVGGNQDRVLRGLVGGGGGELLDVALGQVDVSGFVLGEQLDLVG